MPLLQPAVPSRLFLFYLLFIMSLLQKAEQNYGGESKKHEAEDEQQKVHCDPVCRYGSAGRRGACGVDRDAAAVQHQPYQLTGTACGPGYLGVVVFRMDGVGCDDPVMLLRFVDAGIRLPWAVERPADTGNCFIYCQIVRKIRCAECQPGVFNYDTCRIAVSDDCDCFGSSHRCVSFASY